MCSHAAFLASLNRTALSCLLLQIELDAGDGTFDFDKQALKLVYVPPSSAGDVGQTSIQIMDKGRDDNPSSQLWVWPCYYSFALFRCTRADPSFSNMLLETPHMPCCPSAERYRCSPALVKFVHTVKLRVLPTRPSLPFSIVRSSCLC